MIVPKVAVFIAFGCVGHDKRSDQRREPSLSLGRLDISQNRPILALGLVTSAHVNLGQHIVRLPASLLKTSPYHQRIGIAVKLFIRQHFPYFLGLEGLFRRMDLHMSIFDSAAHQIFILR